MKLNNSIKAFVAGSFFPSLFLPLAYTVIYFIKENELRQSAIQFVPMYLPLMFGGANFIAYFMGARSKLHYWLTGILLGIVVSFTGVFLFDIPEIVFGLHYGYEYLPLILLPILYGAIFRFIVKWMNHLLSLR